jgi:alpha-L-rhamnosidase
VGRAWKASNEKAEHWADAGFDDSAWPTAREVVAFGGSPWGMLAGNITVGPVKADPFFGHCEVAAADLKNSRVYLELGALAPEIAARVTVNGKSVGGFIGKPSRVDVSKQVKAGANMLRIEPFAPESVRLVIYPKRND